MGQIDPVALEDVLHLEVEQILVREHFPLAPEQSLFLVFLEQGIQVIDIYLHDWSLHRCVASAQIKAQAPPIISSLCTTGIHFLHIASTIK
jgi:hypothetical protein